MRVSCRGLNAIDQKEGHPKRYNRGALPVDISLLDTDGDMIKAWVYRVLPPYQELGYVPPRRDYLDLLVRGASRFALPAWHLKALQAVRTAD